MIQDCPVLHDVHTFLKTHCRGRHKAIKAQELAGMFNVNLREINHAVRILRKEGNLIGSSKERPYGYYIPVTDDEINKYLDTFKNELYDMLETYNTQKRARRRHVESLSQDYLFAEVGQTRQLGFSW